MADNFDTFACSKYTYTCTQCFTVTLPRDSLLDSLEEEESIVAPFIRSIRAYIYIFHQFSSFFLVNCYKIVLVTSFLFSEPLPVLIRVSRAFSSVFRSIAHANESGDKSDVITAGISNGVHETASRSSREQECDTVHVCRPMRVESDDGLNKQSRTRVSREIHSFVWYPPRTSPPTPRLHFPCSLSSPFLASVHRVHLIFMSPYI